MSAPWRRGETPFHERRWAEFRADPTWPVPALPDGWDAL